MPEATLSIQAIGLAALDAGLDPERYSGHSLRAGSHAAADRQPAARHARSAHRVVEPAGTPRQSGTCCSGRSASDCSVLPPLPLSPTVWAKPACGGLFWAPAPGSAVSRLHGAATRRTHAASCRAPWQSRPEPSLDRGHSARRGGAYGGAGARSPGRPVRTPQRSSVRVRTPAPVGRPRLRSTAGSTTWSTSKHRCWMGRRPSVRPPRPMPTWPRQAMADQKPEPPALPLIRRIECRSTPLTTDIPLDEPGLAEDRGAGLGAQRRAPEHSSCGVRRRWAPMPPPPKAAERDAAEIYARMAMEENTRRAYRAAVRA